MTLWFKVEYVLRSSPVILARQLQQQDFLLNEGATLGGCRIRRVLSKPRKLKADGEQDHDVFEFTLVDGNDCNKFATGEDVQLIP